MNSECDDQPGSWRNRNAKQKRGATSANPPESSPAHLTSLTFFAQLLIHGYTTNTVFSAHSSKYTEAPPLKCFPLTIPPSSLT
jgi:hypothetical protein